MRRNTVAINNVLKKKKKKKKKGKSWEKNAKKERRNALWITVVIHSILCTGD
jgi:hypothetical protein